jgi:multidrug resistance efflux pump
MLPQRLYPAAKLLPGLLIVAAAVWWGLSIVGTGQPVHAQSPANARAAAGRVEGGSDVLPLGASATGTIAELLVHAGAHVQAGQHLVRVECGAIERELDARKSDLAAAEAFYLRTLHGPRVEEISVGVANVNLAEARLQEAEKALQRTQLLREGFTVTRVQIDQALRDARMDEALLDEVRAKLALLKAGSREEDITETRSRRDADSTRRVRAFVNESEISTMCLHQRAHVTADAVPGIRMDGIVEHIGATVVSDPFARDPSRQSRQVMLSVSGDQQQTPVGLRVTVQFSPCVAGQGGSSK